MDSYRRARLRWDGVFATVVDWNDLARAMRDSEHKDFLLFNTTRAIEVFGRRDITSIAAASRRS